MGADLNIRRATLDDLDHVIAFNAAIAEETEGKVLDAATLREGVRMALADENRALYFVAECDGRVVGQTMVTLEWSDWRNGFFWWIQSVHVIPEFRRRGIFRALYEHIRGLARERGNICGIRLYAYHGNARALETYGRLGMTVGHYVVCEEDWSA